MVPCKSADGARLLCRQRRLSDGGTRGDWGHASEEPNADQNRPMGSEKGRTEQTRLAEGEDCHSSRVGRSAPCHTAPCRCIGATARTPGIRRCALGVRKSCPRTDDRPVHQRACWCRFAKIVRVSSSGSTKAEIVAMPAPASRRSLSSRCGVTMRCSTWQTCAWRRCGSNI